MNMNMVLYYVIIFAVFGGIIFFMNRSQKKKQAREAVQVGDEIITIGGIVARVVSIKDDFFIIESPADHSKMKIKKWALSSVVTVHEEPKVN